MIKGTAPQGSRAQRAEQQQQRQQQQQQQPRQQEMLSDPFSQQQQQQQQQQRRQQPQPPPAQPFLQQTPPPQEAFSQPPPQPAGRLQQREPPSVVPAPVARAEPRGANGLGKEGAAPRASPLLPLPQEGPNPFLNGATTYQPPSGFTVAGPFADQRQERPDGGAAAGGGGAPQTRAVHHHRTDSLAAVAPDGLDPHAEPSFDNPPQFAAHAAQVGAWCRGWAEVTRSAAPVQAGARLEVHSTPNLTRLPGDCQLLNPCFLSVLALPLCTATCTSRACVSRHAAAHRGGAQSGTGLRRVGCRC